MKRHEGPQTPYEVYCDNCRVTAATGTSRCVHCGGRLSGRAQRGGAAVVTELPDDDASEPARLSGVEAAARPEGAEEASMR